MTYWGFGLGVGFKLGRMEWEWVFQGAIFQRPGRFCCLISRRCLLSFTHSQAAGTGSGRFRSPEKNEPPRCCPVLCWVKTSCFTAKLAVLKKEYAQGGTCPRTGGAPDAVPLLLGCLSMDKTGHPAGICPRICRLKAGRPVCLDDRVKMMIRKLAEDGGLAPHATRWWHDPVSTGSRPAGPVRHPWSS